MCIIKNISFKKRKIRLYTLYLKRKAVSYSWCHNDLKSLPHIIRPLITANLTAKLPMIQIKLIRPHLSSQTTK